MGMWRGQGVWRSKVDTRRSFFRLLSTLFSETRPPLNPKISVLAKLTGQRAPGFPRLCPSVAEVHVAISTLTLYLAFWGPELRSSCLCSEHFTHWAISLAQEVPVFQVGLRKKSTMYGQRKMAVTKIRSLFRDVSSSIPAEQSLSVSASAQVKRSISALSAVHQLCLLIFPLKLHILARFALVKHLIIVFGSRGWLHYVNKCQLQTLRLIFFFIVCQKARLFDVQFGCSVFDYVT